MPACRRPNSARSCSENVGSSRVGLSIDSQGILEHFIIDGLSANDDAAGLSGIALGVDAVDQFQVITSGAQAELGRAIGGYINIVTRSGTNVARGDLYGYFRDSALNARNALSGTRLPMSQTQYGGSVAADRRNRTSSSSTPSTTARPDSTGDARAGVGRQTRPPGRGRLAGCRRHHG